MSRGRKPDPDAIMERLAVAENRVRRLTKTRDLAITRVEVLTRKLADAVLKRQDIKRELAQFQE